LNFGGMPSELEQLLRFITEHATSSPSTEQLQFTSQRFDLVFLRPFITSAISKLSTAAIMDVDTIPNLLSEQRDNAPDDLQHYFLTFEDYWERKLWHELTNILIEFFHNEKSAKQRLPLYNTFIKSFANKINQLKLVTLGLSTASQCSSESLWLLPLSRILLTCFR